MDSTSSNKVVAAEKGLNPRGKTLPKKTYEVPKILGFPESPLWIPGVSGDSWVSEGFLGLLGVSQDS